MADGGGRAGGGSRGIVDVDAALASEAFDAFCAANTMRQILGLYRRICLLTGVRASRLPDFYPKLREKLTLNSWRAQAVIKKIDLRANHRVYGGGKVCPNTKVLIVGAGPCGLRTAIECQLLGAKVVVIEKRESMSRNNVLHLWPFVIHDLKALGAKKFFGKFCAGSIDHISIRQLQYILLKIALLTGVEFHEGISFEEILEPEMNDGTEKMGWRARVSPSDHAVSHYEFDVLIRADGKRDTVEGFKRNCLRAKLAIAITTNFIYRHTEHEASVPEISGISSIFNQKFFKDFHRDTGIDLENIVYYKGDTHYFVMTAKKQSLLEKRVLIKDQADTNSLLSKENLNQEALMSYAREAANYATKGLLANLDFAVNHYGLPDVAIFDFTSMFATENACKTYERAGHRLLVCLAGDSLLEPFWPTGSGCARGFLGSLDAAWAVRSWASGIHPLAVMAERESIYRLLAQTTPENLHRNIAGYTLDPATRYPNLNRTAVAPHQVTAYYDTDDPNAKSSETIKSVVNATSLSQPAKKKKRDTLIEPNALLAWLRRQVSAYKIAIDTLSTAVKNGSILCAVINRYRPDLLDYEALDQTDNVTNVDIAFQIFERHFNIPTMLTGKDIADIDNLDMSTVYKYLLQIYYAFKGEIPHIGAPAYDLSEIEKDNTTFNRREANHMSNFKPKGMKLFNADTSTNKRQRKRKSTSPQCSTGLSTEERMQRLLDIQQNRLERQNKRREERFNATMQFYRNFQLMQAGEANPTLPESTDPFEDYSIYTYRQHAPEFKSRVKSLEQKLLFPDRERGIGILPSSKNQIPDEFSKRIKSINDKFQGGSSITHKKPKDLMRAIGKIEKTDWNVREIENKILENKMGKSPAHGGEKVPKWNREQFLARQSRLQKHALDKQDSCEGKFKQIDNSLKNLGKILKEGSVLEVGQRGNNKVANLADKFSKISKAAPEDKPPAATQLVRSKTITTVEYTPKCLVCKKPVYIVERITSENHIFHKSCFRCHYCLAALRVGFSVTVNDKFYCPQHANIEKPSKPSFMDLDILDQGRSRTANNREALQSNREEVPRSGSPCAVMDEDEWQNRNFGNSSFYSCSSSSSSSEDEDEDEKEDFVSKSNLLYYDNMSGEESEDDYSDNSEEFSYHEYSSGDDSGSATECSEERLARERRKQEVALKPVPPAVDDTATESETSSSDETEKSSEAANSATEVSTDSEFAHDDPTPTRELPSICINDKFVTVTRGSKGGRGKAPFERHRPVGAIKDNNIPTKVEIKSGIIHTGGDVKKSAQLKRDILESNNTKVVEVPHPSNVSPKATDYLLSRTQSTSGIATKRALELKKKYLLGALSPLAIQKSDSASQLDSKFKSFHSNISECQKLLNPGAGISPTMQAFLDNAVKRVPPLSPSNPTIISDAEGLQYFPILKTDFNKPENIIITHKNLPDVIQNTFSCFTNKAEAKSSDTKGEDAKTPVNDSPKILSKDNVKCDSPILETLIMVPKVKWGAVEDKKEARGGTGTETDMDSDSLSAASSTDQESSKQASQPIAVPRLEIHDTCGELMQLDSLMIVNGQYIGPINSDDDCAESQSNAADKTVKMGDNSTANSESGNDITTLALTETELSDWAIDGAVSDNFDDVEYKLSSDKNTQRLKKPKNVPKLKSPTPRKVDGLSHVEHICGKSTVAVSDAKHSSISLATEDFDFMDTGSEDSLIETLASTTNKILLKNRGFMEVIDNPEPQKRNTFCCTNNFTTNETSHSLLNRELDSPTNDRSINFIEQGACILENLEVDYNVNDKKKECLGNIENLSQHFSDDINDSGFHNPSGENTDTSKTICEYESDKTPTLTLCINTSSCENHNESSEKVNDLPSEFDYIPETVVEIAADLSGNFKIFDECENLSTKPKSTCTKEVTDITVAPATSANANNFSPRSPSTAKKLLEISIDKTKQKDLIRDLVMDRLASKRLSSSEKRSSRRSRNSAYEMLNKSDDSSGVNNKYSIKSNDIPLSNNNILIDSAIDLDNRIHSTAINKLKIEYENQMQSGQSDLQGVDQKHPKPNIIQSPKKCTSFQAKPSDTIKTVHKSNADLSARANNTPIMFNDNQLPLVAKLNQKGEFILRPRVLSDATDHNTWKLHSFSKANRNPSDMSQVVTEYKPLAAKDGHGCILKGKRVASTEDVLQNKPCNELSLSDPELMRSASYVKCKDKLRDKERRKSIIQTVSSFFNKRLSPKQKEKSKTNDAIPSVPKKSMSECELNSGQLRKCLQRNEQFTDQIKRAPSHSTVRYSGENISARDVYPQRNSKFDSNVKLPEKNNFFLPEISHSYSISDRMEDIIDDCTPDSLLTREEISARIEKTEQCIKAHEKTLSGLEERFSQSSSSPNDDEKELLIEWFNHRRRLLAARRVQRDLASRIADMRLHNRHLRLRRRLKHILNGQSATLPSQPDSPISENDNAFEESAIITEIVEIKAQRESLATLRSQDKKSANTVDTKDIERRISAGVLNYKDLQRILPQ